MADLSAFQTNVQAFLAQAKADLANLKTSKAGTLAADVAAGAALVEGEAQVLLAEGVNALVSRGAKVVKDVEKAERDPATKWYIRGAIVLVAVGLAIAVYAGVHH
jgi:hypothetical protein